MKKDIENGQENKLMFLEKKLLTFLKTSKFSAAIEEGYRILRKQGPQPFIYKCVIVALCRTGQIADCYKLLSQWERSLPMDPVHRDVRSKVEAFQSAIKNSGGDPGNTLIYLEKSLGLTEEWVFRNCDDSFGKFRFRTPPRQHSGKYTLCPTQLKSDCFYGDHCLSAHSSEELEEWNLRMDSISPNFFEMNLSSAKQLEPIGANKHRICSTSTTKGPRLINGHLNGNFNSQNGLFPTTQTFQFSNGRTVTTNVYTNESQFNQNYGICHNPPYLNELIAKYRACTDLSTLFVFDLEDVKFKPFSSLSLKTKYRQHEWAFAMATSTALRTVSLLHDENRRHFHISEGTFYNGTNIINLKNLHIVNRNSKLQVLNTFIPSDILKDSGGWPQWFYYKIEIQFRAEQPGKYRQTIVFDFKKDPKLVKEVNIDVTDFEGSDSTEVLDRIIPPDNSDVQVVVVDSNSDFPTADGGWISSTRSKACTSLHLNKLNYVSEMTRILGQEISCRQSELKKLDKIQDLIPTYTCIVDGKQKIGNQLYCTIELGTSLSEDDPVGKLVQRSCHQVLLTSSDYPLRSYMCLITEKLKSSVVIAMGNTIVQDLALKVDRAYNFKVELNLDVKYFDKMKKALNIISDEELEFLFPDFTKDIIFEHDRLNIFLEGPCTLNPRQMDAYTSITNSVVGLNRIPPVILIGPFGTGKTYTLCQSIRKLLQCQPSSRILICTHSNSAADIYVTSMDEWKVKNFQPLRVYFHDRRVQTVSTTVKKYCTFDEFGKFRYPTKEEVFTHRVIVATLSITPELVRIGLGKCEPHSAFFTYIIIDETAQVLEAEAIEPFLLANSRTRIVLAGDHMQLSPELYSPQGGASINILERLNSLYPELHPCKIMLNENYRSQEKILKFAGDHFYSSSLRCSTIQPTHPQLYPLTFFSVCGQEASGPTSFFNSAEIQELATRLEYLITFWPPQWGCLEDPNSIAILTPYADQVQRLRAHLRLRNLGYVTVERVQNVQGKQFRVVFISTVRTQRLGPESALDLGFLSNPKLLNTALTRAQSLVAVVGDPVSLCSTGNCRNIWLAFIQEAMLNNALHGINYDKFKTCLTVAEAERQRLGGAKYHISIPENISYNIQPNQQVRSPSVSLAQPDIYNSLYTNFGPSPLTNSTLKSDNSNKIEHQPHDISTAISNSSNSAIDNLQQNFSPKVHTATYEQTCNNFGTQNYNGSHNPTIGSPKSFYQGRISSNHLINNFSTQSIVPLPPHQIQRNIPLLNGHSVLNGGTLVNGIHAQHVHPPGFSERPAVINMHTFEQFDKAISVSNSYSKSPIENIIINNSQPSAPAPTVVAAIPNGSAKFPNNITAASVKAVKIEKTNDVRSNAGKSIPPTFEFPLDDFPSLSNEPSKKSAEWIEVKPKKSKPQVNTSDKSKDGSEKTVVEKIEILLNMGFDKKRAIKALQMSERDLAKALELLLAGKEKIAAK